MKKTILALLMLSFTLPVFAQVGITVGGNLTQYKYTSDRQPIFAFNAGLTYEQQLSGNFKWKPEVIYTVKGAAVYPPTPIGSTNPVMKYVNKIGFIQIGSPFVIHTPIEEFAFELGAGPYAGYVISAVNNAENWDGTKTKRDFAVGGNVSDDFKPFDFGINFITGFTIGSKLGMHVKYDLGLANLSPNPAYPPLKMRSVSFNLSFKFGETD